MFQRILVPLDGSARAEQALPVAARLARASNGSVIVMQVVSLPTDYWGYLSVSPFVVEHLVETALAEAKSYLRSVAESTALAGLKMQTEVRFGTPADHILAEAESEHVDLIVLCSHGRTGFKRWALGSVAHKLVHHSSVPVLVLREGQTVPPLFPAGTARPLCALVALDGSELAETALTPAADLITALAAPDRGALHLIQVVKVVSMVAEEIFVNILNKEALDQAKRYLATVQERLQERLKDSRLSITWSVVPDTDVADTVIRIAEQGKEGAMATGTGNYDLIAMSTHGRGALERWVMGSMTERVLNGTKLPMLIVRLQKVERAKS
jgi:nucleotide-binding universal stress UspA family protein